MDKRIGIFVGSFDPFTIGHASVVRRALPLFDKIVIGVGENNRKAYMFDTETRVKAIRGLYHGDQRIEVKAYDDLTIDFAKREGSRYVIKGIRNVRDLEFEREQADVNRVIGGIDTILLLSEAGLDSVSSSLVRELIRFGKGFDEFIPREKDDNI